MGTEEEEVQAKGIHNIFNKIITENLPIQMQEASRTPNRLYQNRTITKNKERILKHVREKKQVTYKGKPIKITAKFST
jgi:hypothetical protein